VRRWVMLSRFKVSMNREEVNCVVGGQGYVGLTAALGQPVQQPAQPMPARLRSGNGAIGSSRRSPACSSQSHTPSRPSPRSAPPRSWSYRTARSDSVRRLRHGPTPFSSCLQTTRANQQPALAHHSQHPLAIHRKIFFSLQPPSHAAISVRGLFPACHDDLIVVLSIGPAASRLLSVVQTRPADG